METAQSWLLTEWTQSCLYTVVRKKIIQGKNKYLKHIVPKVYPILEKQSFTLYISNYFHYYILDEPRKFCYTFFIQVTEIVTCIEWLWRKSFNLAMFTNRMLLWLNIRITEHVEFECQCTPTLQLHPHNLTSLDPWQRVQCVSSQMSHHVLELHILSSGGDERETEQEGRHHLWRSEEEGESAIMGGLRCDERERLIKVMAPLFCFFLKRRYLWGLISDRNWKWICHYDHKILFDCMSLWMSCWRNWP